MSYALADVAVRHGMLYLTLATPWLGISFICITNSLVASSSLTPLHYPSDAGRHTLQSFNNTSYTLVISFGRLRHANKHTHIVLKRVTREAKHTLSSLPPDHSNKSHFHYRRYVFHQKPLRNCERAQCSCCTLASSMAITVNLPSSHRQICNTIRKHNNAM